MSITIEVDFKDVIRWFERAERLPRGRKATQELADRVGDEIRNSISRGGNQGKGRGLTTFSYGGAVQWAVGRAWMPTHPRWVTLRGKSHNRPLFHTGRFQRSITQYVAGKGIAIVGNVDTGGSTSGGWRFHFGDPSPSWTWGAQVDSSGAISNVGSIQDWTPGFKFQWFSPRIIPRPIWFVFQKDVDIWWKKVGARFGKS